MRLVKLGLGNLDPKVGAFKANAQKILDQARIAASQGCQVFAVGEQSISGYPCEDRVQWPDFVEAQGAALTWLCNELSKLGGTGSSMVTIVGLTIKLDGNLYNVAAVIADGTLVGLVPKENLPDYNVFYEGRTITPGYIGLNETWHQGPDSDIPIGDMIFQFQFGKMAVEICEDIWRPDGPMVRHCYAGAELIVNISASPFRIGVNNTRKEMICTRASDNNAIVAYVNLTGGQDNLVFDGRSYVSSCGRLDHEAEGFKEQVTTCVVDLDRATRMRTQNTTWRRGMQDWKKANKDVVQTVSVLRTRSCGALDHKLQYPFPKHKNFFMPAPGAERDAYFAELRQAIMLGLNDYFRKSGVFDRILIALSGGFDSCLTAVLAHDALVQEANRLGLNDEERAAFIKDKLWLVNMPSQFNEDSTKDISSTLAEGLGATYLVSPITEEHELEMRRVLEMKQKMMPSGDKSLKRITKQNIQARIRGERMQNMANEFGGMWLQTSNMSEKAVGYTTVGGDMMGALSVIANLVKTVIIEFTAWLLSKAEVGDKVWHALNNLLKSKPSAELEPDQEDEKDLMPYAVLDACLYLFVNEKLTLKQVRDVIRHMWSDDELLKMSPAYKKGDITKWVKLFGKKFFANIHKWVQCPLSLHLGAVDLDRERALQIPVIQEAEVDAIFEDEHELI